MNDGRRAQTDLNKLNENVEKVTSLGIMKKGEKLSKQFSLDWCPWTRIKAVKI